MSVYEAMKDVLALVQKSDNLSLYKKLSTIQSEVERLEEENKDLKAELSRIREAFRVKGNVVYELNAYWLTTDGKREGPYCSRCWQSEQKLTRLATHASFRHSICPVCSMTVPGVFP